MVDAFDEMTGADGTPRPAYAQLARWLAEVRPDVLDFRRREAEVLFRRIGITFAVYGDPDAQERLIPFDVLPRILAADEWQIVRGGLEQRVQAINHYIRDIYGRREILKAGIIPEDLVFQNPVFRPEMNGMKVPHDIYVHIAGIDIVRVDPQTFYVLEDNARTPSGVSYMLENREIMLRLFPELFARHRIAPVENYPDELLATFKSIAPANAGAEPTVVLLTPGVYNSAYYEHSFLADKLGVELVEGRAPPRGPRALMWSTGVSTTIFSTPSPSGLTRRSACPDCCRPIRPAMSLSQMRWGPELPMTRRSTVTCRELSNFISGPSRSLEMYRRGAAASPNTWAMCSIIWTSWSSRKCTARAATVCS
jgi:hypothetical protein